MTLRRVQNSLDQRRASPVRATFDNRRTIAESGRLANRARPLVVINFKATNPNYVDALYTAISRALDRDPSAKFDLVAVSPTAGSADQSDCPLLQNRKGERGGCDAVAFENGPPRRPHDIVGDDKQRGSTQRSPNLCALTTPSGSFVEADPSSSRLT